MLELLGLVVVTVVVGAVINLALGGPPEEEGIADEVECGEEGSLRGPVLPRSLPKARKRDRERARRSRQIEAGTLREENGLRT